MTTYSANKYNITITQGDDWSFPITFSTLLNNVKTPMDLTGATIVGIVRPTYTTGNAVVMGVIDGDLTLGQVTLTLSDTQTNSLPAGALVYSISITIGGDTQTYVSGNFIVKSRIYAV